MRRRVAFAWRGSGQRGAGAAWREDYTRGGRNGMMCAHAASPPRRLNPLPRRRHELRTTVLAWTLVLALVQVLLPAVLRDAETGIGYNASPRDEPRRAAREAHGPPDARAEQPLRDAAGRIGRCRADRACRGPAGYAHALGVLLYFAARLITCCSTRRACRSSARSAWLVSLAGIILVLIPIV